jgi:hypothetical protein
VSNDEYRQLTASIATTIADYRTGEIGEPTPEHVHQWVLQFDDSVRLPVLRELDHVLGQTYFSRERVDAFLAGLVTSDNVTQGDPLAFWRGASFLSIQGGGQSQCDLLTAFGAVLSAELDLDITECGGGGTYVYLDDGVFTGRRAASDLIAWAESGAPAHATVHVISVASHTGSYYWRDRLTEAIVATGKSIEVKWWCSLMLENRNTYRTGSDVLWPTALPDDDPTLVYAAGLEYGLAFRSGDSVGEAAIFSSAAGRACLEQEFLTAGVRIRAMAPNLPDPHRPLGYSLLQTLGFGSMVVTYRNCPNNAPLALWVHDPWYPLFKRKTN